MPTGCEPVGGAAAPTPAPGEKPGGGEPPGGEDAPGTGGEPGDAGGPAVDWEPEGEGGPGADRGRNLALVSLLLGLAALLLSFVFVLGAAAIGTGLVARGRSRSGGTRRRAMATTGAVLGVLSLVIGAAIIGLLVHVDQTDRTFTSLRAGECVDPAGGLLAHYTLTGCSKPHRYEAYGVVTALGPSGSPWPGAYGFGLDSTQCTPLILQYLDGPLDRSRLQTVELVPTQADWDRGIRRIVCVVEAAGGKRLVGSVRGSAAGSSSGGST